MLGGTAQLRGYQVRPLREVVGGARNGEPPPQQCAAMERSGVIEIGSHPHTHRDLLRWPDQFASDLQASPALLEQRLGPGPRAWMGAARESSAAPCRPE